MKKTVNASCKNGGGAGMLFCKTSDISVIFLTKLNLITVIYRFNRRESKAENCMILYLAPIRKFKNIFYRNGGGAGIVFNYNSEQLNYDFKSTN
jgi:hypothetical protein